MNGIDLMNNLIDELGRARDLLKEMPTENSREDEIVNELISDIIIDLDRYYDYADSIDELLVDLEIED